MSPMTVLLALQAAAATPFGVGERFEYDAKFGVLNVGSATIEVAPTESVRGQPAYHFRFYLKASALVFRIESTIESWTSVTGFHSLRFRRDNLQNGKRYLRSFEILGDSGYYRQVDPEPLPSDKSVSEPLDDASFLYFVRTIPLEVGKSYQFTRYYWAAKNPITIEVKKREKMELPDGSKVTCLVINPIVGESGLFAKSADAKLWLTDDARRIPVQIKSTYRFGTVTLKLDKIVGAHAP